MERRPGGSGPDRGMANAAPWHPARAGNGSAPLAWSWAGDLPRGPGAPRSAPSNGIATMTQRTDRIAIGINLEASVDG